MRELTHRRDSLNRLTNATRRPIGTRVDTNTSSPLSTTGGSSPTRSASPVTTLNYMPMRTNLLAGKHVIAVEDFTKDMVWCLMVLF
jgi:hypothetical protein